MISVWVIAVALVSL